MNQKPVQNTGHYIHHINYNRRERMVGLFVFSAIILIAMLFFISGKSQHFFDQRISFHMNVKSSEGINEGNVVTLLGTEIGKVSSLKLTHGSKIHVTLDIYKSQHDLIRADAKVVVNRLVGLGSALIEIQTGSVDAPVLAEGATLPVEETPSLNDVVLGIARIVQSADSGLLTDLSEVMPKLEKTIENAQKIIAQIASGQGTLGAAVFDLSVEQEMRQVVQSGAKILSDAEGIVTIASQRLVELEPVISGAEHLMLDLQGATQSLPEMMTELKKTISLAQATLNLLNEELHYLPGTVLEARRTLNRADNLLQGVQNIWPLSTSGQEPSLAPLIPVQPIHE